MRKERVITALQSRCKPEDVAANWPRDLRLLWLHSSRVHPRWAQWSMLATPVATFRFDGRSHLEGDLPPALSDLELTNDALQDLDALLAATAVDPHLLDNADSPLPFRGGWIGSIAYDLGRIIEPRTQHDPTRVAEGDWPLIELAWCPNALVFDHLRMRWSAIGEIPECLQQEANRPNGFRLGDIEADIDPAEYERMVARTIAYIAAGDIFQANIAQRFRTPFDGSTRALALAAFANAKPWYGAYLELEDSRRLLSLSPELFLQSNSPPHARRIVTRPIKGTRPAACDPCELRDSIKDEAELNMIVDLMRNDLGRLCEFGSVRVPQPRGIESHPTVHHGVAEITGIVRDVATFGDVLRATFPPGSVTGAPKIRAMQIIDELESGKPRGPYCGAIGFISDCGAMALNVAIRTLLIDGQCEDDRCDVLRDGEVTYSAGAGIVADSDPAREQQETLDKIAVLRAMSSGTAAQMPAREALIADR